MQEDDKKRYEDNIHIIDQCLDSQKGKWNETSVPWKQWEDVAQDLRKHIFEKWHTYNPERPLKPWVLRIIHNQVFNIKRNIWGKFAKPCSSCDASLPSGMCKIFTYQSDECAQFAHWQRTKEKAYNLNNAVSMDVPNRNENEITKIQVEFKKIIFEIEEELKFQLTPREMQFYTLYFVQNLSEEDVVEKMNLNKPTDGLKNKTIKNFEKSIGEKAAKILNLK